MPPTATFAPLAHRLFAMAMAGVLLSNLGNAIQSVGAAWQLTANGEPADVVALVQTAINLPMLLLALPAGAFADMHDRRSIILAAQGGMLTVSLLLCALTLAGDPPAWVIIGLTTLLACGIACYGPAMGASIGGTVPRAQLAAAVALNILIFNAARAIGPAVGGAVVAAGGAGAAFAVNALSYALAIAVFWRWRPEQPPRPEKRPLTAMIAEGLRHSAASREIRTILLRAASFTATGAAAWALMPLVAADLLGRGASTYGLLLGALGLGAVAGASLATYFRSRYSAEKIIRTAGMTYGIALIGVALAPRLGGGSTSSSSAELTVMFALLVVAGARGGRARGRAGERGHLRRHRARQLAVGTPGAGSRRRQRAARLGCRNGIAAAARPAAADAGTRGAARDLGQSRRAAAHLSPARPPPAEPRCWHRSARRRIRSSSPSPCPTPRRTGRTG